MLLAAGVIACSVTYFRIYQPALLFVMLERYLDKVGLFYGRKSRVVHVFVLAVFLFDQCRRIELLERQSSWPGELVRHFGRYTCHLEILAGDQARQRNVK